MRSRAGASMPTYVEKANPTDYQPPATCATCHDPHGSSNPNQLRYPVTSADPDQNLCMKCHNRRAEPEPPSTVTPHAPQGAVLLGYAGWRPPGFVYDTARIYGSHATTKNPKLCAGCHVLQFTVNDPTSGNFVFKATGHLFRPIPCLDAHGQADSRQDVRVHDGRANLAVLHAVRVSRRRGCGGLGVQQRSHSHEDGHGTAVAGHE